MLAPTLAAGIGDLVPVIFVIIAIIGAIMNWIGGAKKPPGQPAVPNRPRRPPRPRDRRLQNEIDNFLQEITGKKVQQEEAVEVVDIEPPPPRRVARRPAGRPQPAANLQKTPPRPEPAQPHQKPGTGIASRKGPGSKDLGAGVKKHLAEHMQAGRVTSHVEQYLDHEIDAGVAAHLGAFSAEQSKQGKTLASVSVRAVPLAVSVVGLLRDPVGVRQAIIASEILSPPKCRRGQS